MGTLFSGGLQSIVGTALQGIGLTHRKAAGSPAGSSSSSAAQQPDGGQLSPFAQTMLTLQPLQQSSPTGYEKATRQIAVNLQAAAQAAQAGGNQSAASQLSQLATNFSHASQTGQLPNLQDLAQGVFGQHLHSPTAAVGSNGNSGGSSGTTPANQALAQLFSSLQPSGSASGALNPLTIISQTLSGAKIGATA